ncbi:unnamed protein product [Parnassius apollo]|uniref:(apollo) hypothetical protein n=1 Tax=Parnassius apollo TaxID=110799 RepID=A0A8S3WFG2_PARAO|nr:unnamed protein product [Parnassius apollo]
MKDGVTLSDQESATKFAKYFYSVYNSEPARLNLDEAVLAGGAGSARVHVPQLQLGEVRAALARLKPKRSAGPDGIPAFVIRDCRSVLAEPLLREHCTKIHILDKKDKSKFTSLSIAHNIHKRLEIRVM